MLYGCEVVHAYPHDREAFTQGLIYRDGFLFESTGLHGRSSLRKVRLETGEVVQRLAVPAQYFAEGLADWERTLNEAMDRMPKCWPDNCYDIFTCGAARSAIERRKPRVSTA